MKRPWEYRRQAEECRIFAGGLAVMGLLAAAIGGLVAWDIGGLPLLGCAVATLACFMGAAIEASESARLFRRAKEESLYQPQERL
jgi:hypothetical protein